MTILLARTSNGISAFYAPMRRVRPQNSISLPSGTELNGTSIQRLESKLGTRALPTAELVLSKTRAYLLSTEGRGVREIATVLNVTRVHNTVTALGLWGRRLAISRAFAQARKTSPNGRLLTDVPAHVKTLAAQIVAYRVNMHFTFFVVRLLGATEQASWLSSESRMRPLSHLSLLIPSSLASVILLLRTLTPVLKPLTAKASIDGLAETMESLGGIGYLGSEDMRFNVAPLFRDATVISIWEGTTDVMGGDTVKVLKGREGPKVLKVLEQWMQEVLDREAEAEAGH